MKPLHSLQVEMKPIIPHVIDKKEEELNPEKGEKNRKKREFKDTECKTKGKVLSIAYQDMSMQTFTFGPQGTLSVFGAACSDFHLHFYVWGRGRYEFFRSIHVGEVL